MIFDTQRSVNSPQEYRKINNEMMKSQTHWQVDAEYRKILEKEEEKKHAVSAETKKNRIKDQKRFNSIERL